MPIKYIYNWCVYSADVSESHTVKDIEAENDNIHVLVELPKIPSNQGNKCLLKWIVYHLKKTQQTVEVVVFIF